jgi:hypothetical protein
MVYLHRVHAHFPTRLAPSLSSCCLLLLLGLPALDLSAWIAPMVFHYMLQIPGSAGPFEHPPSCLR